MLTRPIRLAYVIDNLGVAGTEQWLLRLIQALDPERVQPHLILLDGSSLASRELEPKGLPVLRLGIHSFQRPGLLLSAGRRLVRYFRQQQIDIVQLQFTNSTNFAAPLAWWAGVPVVLATSRNTGYWLTAGRKRVGRWSHRFVSGTIANSQASRQSAIDAFGLKPESVTIIPNGIDRSRFVSVPPLRTSLRRGERWRIGMVANLRPVKDVHTFVRAASLVLRQIAEVDFLIAGEGSERENLVRLAQQLDCSERVQFLGPVPDVPGFLGQLDVAVLCSLSEGLSNSLLEYLAAGRAVVATDVGGNSDLILAEKTGLLSPPGDPQSLAEHCCRLLRERTQALEMARAGLTHVLQHFTLESERDCYQQYYADSLAKRLACHRVPALSMEEGG